MRHIIAYDLEVIGGNFFMVTFINTKTNGKMTCYKLDNISVRTNIINMLIENSLFVGYKNSMHNDIILNYIFHHDDINTKELFTLSTTIKECNEKGIALWSHPLISYYIEAYISGLDLFKIASITNIEVPNKKELPILRNQHVTDDDVDAISTYIIDNTENVNGLIGDVKERLNHGFKHSSKEPITSDQSYRNFIAEQLQLNDNERIYKEREELWK